MIKKLIGTGLVLLVALGACYGLMHLLGWDDLTKEELQDFIRSTGVVAPLVYIAISFFQVTLIPIPGSVTVLAANYLFGPWLAFLYSYIGQLAGAMVAFWLGKIIGRRFANWIAGDKEEVDKLLQKLHGRENVVLFFMFLFPFFPDDVLCALAGILPITGQGFFFMQLITRATSTGATLLLMSGELIPFEDWGLIVLGAIVALGIIAFILCFKYSDKINAWADKILAKIFKSRKKDAEAVEPESQEYTGFE